MKLGVIMDPIAGIKVEKDTTLAMLLAAQRREWEIHYMEMKDVYLTGNTARANARVLTVTDDKTRWFQFQHRADLALAELDVILMRKDPPFDMEYIYVTYILEHAAACGTLVVNDPAALRDVNEKAFITQFPECIAPTLISRDPQRIHAFVDQHGQAVLKPWTAWGGPRFSVLTGKTPTETSSWKP